MKCTTSQTIKDVHNVIDTFVYNAYTLTTISCYVGILEVHVDHLYCIRKVLMTVWPLVVHACIYIHTQVSALNSMAAPQGLVSNVGVVLNITCLIIPFWQWQWMCDSQPVPVNLKISRLAEELTEFEKSAKQPHYSLGRYQEELHTSDHSKHTERKHVLPLHDTHHSTALSTLCSQLQKGYYLQVRSKYNIAKCIDMWICTMHGAERIPLLSVSQGLGKSLCWHHLLILHKMKTL